MHSRTEENYIKAVYRHGREHPEGNATLGEIARDLEVTPGTVTQMMKHLMQRGLVSYQSRRGAALTRQGELTALGIVRRHRLIECFLVEVMGMDWADVHDEAEELEHVVSARLVARMDEMLGHPTHDPHGAPIPTSEGVIDSGQGRPLAACSPGCYRLVQVDEGSGDFLAWCKRNGLVPGAGIELVQADPFAETYTLRVADGEPFSIGTGSAAKLLVHDPSDG
jgi:DtxR family Mn-dependent transcriptional regulator